MKRLFLVLSLAIGVWTLAPTPEAEARGWNSAKSGRSHHARKHHRYGRHRGHGAPELDPNAAGSAMVLLLGGVAYLASRRREDDLA